MVTEVAKRYAAALFEIAPDKSLHAQVLDQLRDLSRALLGQDETAKFFASPLVRAEEKAAAVKAALEGSTLPNEIKSLAQALASRNRVEELPAVVQAYQEKTDAAHGIVRGLVRSAAPLDQKQRQALEARVAVATGKKVILEYKDDPTLLGGLVAQVGSLTFDDSLETQIRLMNEALKRSGH